MSELDYKDLRILEGLCTYGPRNVSRVARKIGVHPETVRKRLKNLQPPLSFHVSTYHTNLGLKKAVVFAQVVPGCEDVLLRCLKANDFWIFMTRSYGMNEGCVAVYTIPKDHCSQFEQFLEELRTSAVAKEVQVFWSTCFHAVQSRCNWFDPGSGTWNFQWDKWVEEIPDEGTELPYTLVDPDSWRIRADDIDIFILKELEKDATISFKDLADMLDVSPQLIGYHYRNHIVKKNLMEGFEAEILHFGKDSDLFFFIFTFDNYRMLAKFALSLTDKPFVRGIGKILRENSLLCYLNLPKHEFRTFVDTLSKLIKEGLLQSYQYVIQDPQKSSVQTIPYEYFNGESWIYDHSKQIENLHKMMETCPRKA